MLKFIFQKIKYFSKFIISMIITFFGFFLSNKDEDEGTQKTIDYQNKIKIDNETNLEHQALENHPLDLYPFYKQKTEKLLKEKPADLKHHQKELEKLLKEIPKTEEMKPIRQKIEKRLEEIKTPILTPNTNELKEVKISQPISQKSIPIKDPVIPPKPQVTPIVNPQIKSPIKDVNQNKPKIIDKQPNHQAPEVKSIKPEPKRLVKAAPLVAIVPPIMAMHIIRQAQNKEIRNNQLPNYTVQKSSPPAIAEPKIVPKKKYIIPQVYLNEAIHLSKKLDHDAINKKKLTEKKDNIPDKINYLLNKPTESKTRLLPFKLFKRKEVQGLYNASILNNNLVSSVNLINGTNLNYHKVHFLTLLSPKKTLASLENITIKNIETAQMLKVSMKNKYGNKMQNNPKLNSILKRLEDLEEELNKKYERINNPNYSKAKMKSKKPSRPF